MENGASARQFSCFPIFDDRERPGIKSASQCIASRHRLLLFWPDGRGPSKSESGPGHIRRPAGGLLPNPAGDLVREFGLANLSFIIYVSGIRAHSPPSPAAAIATRVS